MKLKALLTWAVILAGIVAVICLLTRKGSKEPIVSVEIDDPGMEYAPQVEVPSIGAMATPGKSMSIVTATKGNWN